MKKKLTTLKRWASCIALAGLLFGCAKNTENRGDGDKSLYITVKIPAVNEGISVRGVGDEVAIKSAYIIVYGDGASAAELPKYATKLELTDIEAVGTAGERKILAFSPSDNIIVGDVVNIVFNKEIANLSIPKGDLISTLKLTSATGLIDLTAGLPMYGNGEWTATGSPIISVNRAVAKIQLKLDYKNGTHVSGSNGSTFTTERTTYKLYQLSDAGNIDGSAVGSTVVSPITEIPNENEIDQPSATKDDNYTGANFIFGYPYATKSIGSTPSTLAPADFALSRIAMIMKNIQDDGTAIYHRLDVYDKANATYYNIVNNFHYSIRVREVSNGGYSTATEALKHPASNVQFYVEVEEEGTLIASNGQYVLNLNESGREFTASGASSTIEIAKVNRHTSVNADIEGATSFRVEKEEIFKLGDIAVTFTGTPTSLDNSVKSLNVTALGEGISVFRYKVILGNIEQTSGVTTVKSEGYSDNMLIDGFVADLGVANGYASNIKFTIGAGLKYKVSTTFKEEWDASLSLASPTAAPTKFTSLAKTSSIAETLSDGTTIDGFYLNIYRTAPGDKNIVGSVDVTVILPDKTKYTYSIGVTVTTSCDLPGEKENYGVKINGLLWADRNVGATMPTDANYLVSKNYSNDSNHPDYNASLKGAIVGSYHTISAIGGKCETLGLGKGDWRMPSAETDLLKGEIANAKASIRHSKGRVFLVGDVEETAPTASTTTASGADLSSTSKSARSIGCFLPLSGSSASLMSGYWSSRANYSLNISSTSSNVSSSSASSQFTLRCVKEHYDLLPAITVEGFYAGINNTDRPSGTVKDGYDLHTLFGISKTTHTITIAESSFNKYWDGLLSVSKSISTTPTPSKWNAPNSGELLNVSSNTMYFHPFRTAPGDLDVAGVLRVKGMTREGSSFSLELPLTIVTSCKLPTAAENYSIAINSLMVADRNVGSKLPTVDYPTANKYFTNQTDHPDYIAGSIGGPTLDRWSKQLPAISSIAGEYYAQAPANGMASVYKACDTFSLGTGVGSWRLPDESKLGDAEINLMNTQVRQSKYRIYLLSTSTTTIPAEGTIPSFVEYSGVFLPLVAKSDSPTSVSSFYWSSASNNYNGCLLIVNPASSTVTYAQRSYGFSARCVSI